jgi:hypothetical protein
MEGSERLPNVGVEAQNRAVEDLQTSCRLLASLGITLTRISSQILSPWLGDVVDYGIGLSYRSARLHGLAENPTPELAISPIQGLRIWLQEPDPSQSERGFRIRINVM